MKKIADYSLLTSSLLSIPAWLADNAIQLGSLFCVFIGTVFACIHYWKSWQLKDLESKKLQIELNQQEENDKEI